MAPIPSITTTSSTPSTTYTSTAGPTIRWPTGQHDDPFRGLSHAVTAAARRRTMEPPSTARATEPAPILWGDDVRSVRSDPPVGHEHRPSGAPRRRRRARPGHRRAVV